ncbi:hypothetical protein C8R41DRAFT_447525 [Lentinula lateritia]|uniref:Uncharacterized protein n=1 Tax=Lentinula lateritia TaxID=40482 RepID=A0ABQ8VE12_9AGAR|nr:hypothetical protein C8R41DRAFT_447525 [Lentinula lateritia]
MLMIIPLSHLLLLLASPTLLIPGRASPVPTSSTSPPLHTPLPRWFPRPSILPQSTIGKLTDEKKYVLLGFSYTGQLAGTQHDKSLFPLDQLLLPGLPSPQPGEEEGDLMLLQQPSILDPKGLYWKCFIVASLPPWSLALPQLKPLLTHSTPQFPATIHGADLPLQVMRIPKSVWETRGKELGIKGMCVNPRGECGGVFFFTVFFFDCVFDFGRCFVL